MPVDVGELARYDRPMPSVADYDTLLPSSPCAGTGVMSDLQDQAIRQHCKALRMPTIGGQFRRLAEAAVAGAAVPSRLSRGPAGGRDGGAREPGDRAPAARRAGCRG